LEASAAQVAHGDVDVASVNPPAMRVEREELGKKPQLGGSGIETFPVVNIEDSEPELAP
jgi:hypothetical protein